jgi:hypothetical protein
MILLLAAAGLIGTSAGAGAAAGLTSKVSGLLRKDVIVTVDDAVTRLQPVFINGKAYLPAKDTVMQLGYELTYNASNKAITIWDPQKWLNTDGVIVSANKQDGGRFRFELIGIAIKGSSETSNGNPCRRYCSSSVVVNTDPYINRHIQRSFN